MLALEKEGCPAEWVQQFWKSKCFLGMHSAGVVHLKSTIFGNTIVVQWLELYAFTAKDLGSVCSRGTKIPRAICCSQRKKQKAPSSSSPSLSEVMSNPDPLRGPMVSIGLLLLWFKKIFFNWSIFASQYCVGFCHRVACQLSLLPACFIFLSTSQVIYPSAFELPKFCRCSPLFHSPFLLFRLFKETLSRGGKDW